MCRTELDIDLHGVAGLVAVVGACGALRHDDRVEKVRLTRHVLDDAHHDKWLVAKEHDGLLIDAVHTEALSGTGAKNDDVVRTLIMTNVEPTAHPHLALDGVQQPRTRCHHVHLELVLA